MSRIIKELYRSGNTTMGFKKGCIGANKGKKMSDEQKKKISDTKKSNGDYPKIHFQTSGVDNHKWKGDDAGYHAKHSWVYRNFGSPKQCELCNSKKRKMYHWANISGEYKRQRDDWLRLCVPCHKNYDLNKKNV